MDRFQKYLEEQVAIGKKFCEDTLSGKDFEMYHYWMLTTDAHETVLKNYVKFLNDKKSPLF